MASTSSSKLSSQSSMRSSRALPGGSTSMSMSMSTARSLPLPLWREEEGEGEEVPGVIVDAGQGRTAPQSPVRGLITGPKLTRPPCTPPSL